MSQQTVYVYNSTDGVLAWPGQLPINQAREFIREFPKRYERQGYYLTATGERIQPQNVELTLLRACGGSLPHGQTATKAVPELRTMTQEIHEEDTPATESVEAVGNFVFGDWAGDVKCRHGHEVRLFNVNRGHWVACDKCKTYAFIGSNLWSSWRSENEAIWRKNHEDVQGYRYVE